jgi:hypothetical protein
MICAACHLTRDASDLIAFWPIGHLEAGRYVCRPTCPSNRAAAGPCFSQAVRAANVHAIALVVPFLELDPSGGRHWIAPGTSAWGALLAAAGVRGAVTIERWQAFTGRVAERVDG